MRVGDGLAAAVASSVAVGVAPMPGVGVPGVVAPAVGVDVRVARGVADARGRVAVGPTLART